MNLRDPFWRGAMLGVYQAHALIGVPLGFVLVATGHWVGLFFFFSAALGIYGWKRDYAFAWRAK